MLEGRELDSMFAWLRPNDLVWNYWVNNYLLGRNPPAFDILAWNADATNLPAGLHADFLHLLGSTCWPSRARSRYWAAIDLAAVTGDAYIVGGLTDHIIPWPGPTAPSTCWAAAEFVLRLRPHPGDRQPARATGGPGSSPAPGRRRPTRTVARRRRSTQRRAAGGTTGCAGSASAPAPSGGPRPSSGNRRHKPIEPAPGRYAHL